MPARSRYCFSRRGRVCDHSPEGLRVDLFSGAPPGFKQCFRSLQLSQHNRQPHSYLHPAGIQPGPAQPGGTDFAFRDFRESAGERRARRITVQCRGHQHRGREPQPGARTADRRGDDGRVPCPRAGERRGHGADLWQARGTYPARQSKNQAPARCNPAHCRSSRLGRGPDLGPAVWFRRRYGATRRDNRPAGTRRSAGAGGGVRARLNSGRVRMAQRPTMAGDHCGPTSCTPC